MKQTILVTCVVFFALAAGREPFAQEAPPISAEPDLEMLSALTGEGDWQLRIYTINRGHLDDFAEAWREGVYPVRLQHGFKIPAAWLVRETNQFVWVIGYDGPESWDEAQEAYYGSADRTGLEVDPLQWIAHGDAWFITPVSPEAQ